MADSKCRAYRLDGDTVQVIFRYDPATGMYFGDYPDFAETPRITPHGRQWVNAIAEGCPYADDAYGDCGSCPCFCPEQAGDLIGVCNHEKNRVKEQLNEGDSIEVPSCEEKGRNKR